MTQNEGNFCFGVDFNYPALASDGRKEQVLGSGKGEEKKKKTGEKQGLCDRALIRSIKRCVSAHQSRRECDAATRPGEYTASFSPIKEQGAKKGASAESR